jgi:hypothetical protein
VTAVSPAPRGRRGLRLRVRWASTAISVVALGTLIAIGLPGQAARAAGTGYNQITGEGSTDSAITVPWTSGLLDDTNKPITGSPTGELAPNSDRASGSGPLSFMYNDFKNLKVTVSQTQDITQEGLTISWTGGVPSTVSGGAAQANFLQLMECWGDSTNGPDPEDCEFGSLPSNTQNVGTRSGVLCADGLPASTTNPPPVANGNGAPLDGCDPQEAGNSSHVAPCPGTDCDPTHTDFEIPFVPVTLAPPTWGTDYTQYFDRFSTNEVPQAITGKDGTGQLQFETLTATGAPGLGCGVLTSNGQPQDCWLVIVPRGTYEPNGYQVNTNSTAPNGFLQSSPLSASNWANRIQVHLSYATVPVYCPIGTQETQTAGTQIITRAIDSWELALNRQADCTRIYGFSATAEPTSTQDLCDPSSSTVGLAFTTIPIGSEAARDGTPSNCPDLPQILYAPVAVSADGFGFNINDGTGYITTPVKMTPLLMAKALTQVYRYDLPDVYPPVESFKGPTWVQSNPGNISEDPQFANLNPEVPPFGSAAISVAPDLTEDHSALNQQVWQWIQSDPSTDAWLDDGTKSGGNTVNADPDYEKLQLGKSPAADSFPRAYSGFLDLPPEFPPPPPPPPQFSFTVPFTAASAGPAVFTAAGSAYTNGQTVQLSGGAASLPGPFTAGTIYFIVHASGTTFQLAATQGGLGIPNTSKGSGTVQFSAAPQYSFTATKASPAVFTATGSAYAAGETVLLSGASLPGGFTAGTFYFVVHPAGPTFQLAATQGGPGIASTSAGSGTVQFLTPPPPPPPAGDDNTSSTDQTKYSLDLMPYVNNYEDAASKILTAVNTSTGDWDSAIAPPDGVGTGWWATNGNEETGNIFVWGISDTPDLAADGLIDAALCNASGSDCVTPSVASLTAALDSAKPDSAGLLQVNPADPGDGGYPLVEVTYAAVATNQSSAALNDYADLIAYAAGNAGQTPGVGPGNLPPGYLPLPQSLKNQAQAVVAELRADASTSGGPGSGTPAGPAVPGASATPTPSSSPTPEFSVGNPSAVLASATTPGQALGAIRWALVAVVILGAASAASGTVLRSARVPRWLRWVVRSCGTMLRSLRVPRWPRRVARP